MELEGRIRRSIKLRNGPVVLHADFADMGSSAQIGRVIARLVKDGTLVKVSKGAYAKTRVNQFTGTKTPIAPLSEIAAEVFRKLGIALSPTAAEAAYDRGSTQVPAGWMVNTGERRISRKITVGSRTVTYEKNHGRD
ncbi:hypothetical protein JCM19000A_09360 [Silvimonas sp. JCM 19000]